MRPSSSTRGSDPAMGDAVVEQAKGFLAARHGIGMDQAFERLRSHARRNHHTVHVVAERVVARQLDLPGRPHG